MKTLQRKDAKSLRSIQKDFGWIGFAPAFAPSRLRA